MTTDPKSDAHADDNERIKKMVAFAQANPELWAQFEAWDNRVDLAVFGGRVTFSEDEHVLITLLLNKLNPYDNRDGLLSAFVNDPTFAANPPTAAEIVRFLAYVVEAYEGWRDAQFAMEGESTVRWPTDAKRPRYTPIEDEVVV